MPGIIKVSSKGQITLPVGLRKRFNIQPGTCLRFIEEDHDFRMIPASGGISSLRGKVAAKGVQDFKKARHDAMKERIDEKTARD
jgi:AbrB family looped-hinge helix DNA binding protein